MPARPLHTLAFGVVAAVGCQDAKPASPEPVIAVRGGDGTVRMELRPRGGRCAVAGEATLEVTRTPDGAAAQGTADLVLGPSRTPGDQQIAGADGAPQLRIHRSEDRIDVLGADDVPRARISVTAQGGKVTDAARAPVAVLALEADAVAVNAPDGARHAPISGTRDLTVAALLAAPGVPADARGLLACERLLANDVVTR